jgi:hypothetical protein
MVRHRTAAASCSNQLEAFAKIRGKAEVGSRKSDVGRRKSKPEGGFLYIGVQSDFLHQTSDIRHQTSGLNPSIEKEKESQPT